MKRREIMRRMDRDRLEKLFDELIKEEEKGL